MLRSPDTDSEIALSWLIRLRWIALAAQSLSLFVAVHELRLPVLSPLVAACLATTLLTNLTLVAWRRHLRTVAGDACGIVLALDTATLTLLLHATGGAHHPFAVFYLLHLALAGLLLPRRWIAAQLTLCLGGLGWLNLGPGAQPDLPPVAPDLREVGTLVAVALTGITLAVFASRVQGDLRAHRGRLADSRARLARQERFTGLATLAAGVAHELATPLGTIVLASRELERQLAAPEAQADARLIRQQAERCRAIMSRLEAHAETAEPEPLNLAELEPEIAALLPSTHRERLRVTAPAGVYFPAPRAALVQCLTALAKNAAEADPAGRPVEVRVEESADHVGFVVRDHGPGFDPAILGRAGEPFFTTKGPGAGTGLGLYIVRMFADRLGGSVEFAAAAGGGAEVRLTLPRRPPPDPAHDT